MIQAGKIVWKTGPGWEKSHAVISYDKTWRAWPFSLCGRRPVEGWNDSELADQEPRCKVCLKHLEIMKAKV